MSRNSVFQICLLVLLTAIAIGIWVNRGSSSKDTGGAQFVDASTYQKNQVPPVNPSTKPPRTKNSGNATDLLESIENGEQTTIRVAWAEAMRVQNSDYLIEAYLLACKHGTVKALIPMNHMMVPLSNEDEQKILAGLDDLIARKQYDAVRYVLSQNMGFGLTKKPLNKWIGDQFVKEPWDRERMDAVLQRALHFQGTNDLLVRMITASLSGPEDRFKWMCESLYQIPDASPQIAISSLTKSNVINASNVARVLELSSHWHESVDRGELFTACSPYLTAEHTVLVRKALRPSQPPPGLIDYILKYDAQDVSTWAVGNQKFSLALHREFKNAIMAEKGPEALERFASIKTYLVRQCVENSQWDVFAPENIPFTASMKWLWSQGFRPSNEASLALRLYLGIRCQDQDYLRKLIAREKLSLPELLNSGFDFGAIAHVKANDNPRIVPLLTAIEEGDLEVIRILVESKGHNWKTWSFENPLTVAVRANKSDIYRYLGTAGLTENVGMSMPADRQKSNSGPAAKVAIDPRELRTLETASKVVLRIVEAGDLAALENVLAIFPFHPTFQARSNDIQTQLTSYNAETERWRYHPELRKAFEKSIVHPKLFARMLAEGFVIDRPMLLSIVRDGHDEVLQMALCDMVTRELASKHLAELDEAAQIWPKVLRVLAESGVNRP